MRGIQVPGVEYCNTGLARERRPSLSARIRVRERFDDGIKSSYADESASHQCQESQRGTQPVFSCRLPATSKALMMILVGLGMAEEMCV